MATEAHAGKGKGHADAEDRSSKIRVPEHRSDEGCGRPPRETYREVPDHAATSLG